MLYTPAEFLFLAESFTAMKYFLIIQCRHGFVFEGCLTVHLPHEIK